MLLVLHALVLRKILPSSVLLHLGLKLGDEPFPISSACF